MRRGGKIGKMGRRPPDFRPKSRPTAKHARSTRHDEPRTLRGRAPEMTQAFKGETLKFGPDLLGCWTVLTYCVRTATPPPCQWGPPPGRSSLKITATESSVIKVLKNGTPLPPQGHLDEPEEHVRLPVFQKCEVLSAREHGVDKNYRFVKAISRKEIWVVTIKRSKTPLTADMIEEMATIESSVRKTAGPHVTVRGWVISTSELDDPASAIAKGNKYVITTDARLR